MPLPCAQPQINSLDLAVCDLNEIVDYITANFKDGILKIEIPKAEEKKPKQITINVD